MKLNRMMIKSILGYHSVNSNKKIGRNRRLVNLIKLLLLIFVPLTFVSCSTPENGTKPNIIWIIVDDYSPDAEIFGTPGVKTPNVNRLASEGVSYTQAFATNPVCSPSRSVIFTGMYQTSIGAHQHRTRNRSALPDSIPFITDYFQKAGYFTCNGDGFPDSKKGKTDFNFKIEEPFDGTDWSQREQGQPFFAAIQIKKFTHRPFVNRDTNPPVSPDSIIIPPYYPDHPVTRVDWAQYLKTVQAMDTRLGEILDRLERENLLDKSLIFFFADHGRPHVRDKQWLYDGGIQVPLIVRYPQKQKAGETVDRLVSLIDIPVASLSAAGLTPAEAIQGVNFLQGNPKRSFIFAARDRTDAVIDQLRCIRDSNFKYIRNYMPERPYDQYGHYKMYRYPVLTLMHVLNEENKLTSEQQQFLADRKPTEELYDLNADPFEVQNLAEDQRYQEKLEAFRDTLAQFMQQTADMGSFDPDNYDEILTRRKKEYDKKWKKRGIDPVKTPAKEYLKWWEKELGISESPD